MKLAVMQPYFFPYIGYWQLIHASDRFVVFDDCQYMKQGWIHRNRVLKPEGGWQYVIVPLKKRSSTELIRNVQALPGNEWKELILRQLAHYDDKAPHFEATHELVREILFSSNEVAITAINSAVIRQLCGRLDLKAEIVVSSEQGFDYSEVASPGEWALRIAEQTGAAQYINPVAGAALFDPAGFAASNIELSFLQSPKLVYPQHGVFEPSLSIIDVLMFNGIEGTKEFLDRYSLAT